MGIKTGVRVSLQAQPDGKLLIDLMLEGRTIKTKRIDITGCGVKSLERYSLSISLWIRQDRVFIKKNTCRTEAGNQKGLLILIGPEIIEESSDCVVIQDLLNPNELPIKKVYIGCFLLQVHAKG